MTVPMHEDLLTRVGELPWVPMMEGFDFKYLRVSAEIGTWSIILRCAKGSSFPTHKHLGAGEYYVIKGEMDYRAGTAYTGDYGYEPTGVIHDGTNFLEETELVFTNHGPVAFLDAQGNITEVLDYEAIYKMAADHNAI